MIITIQKSDQNVNNLGFSLKKTQATHFLTVWKSRDKVVQCEGYDPPGFPFFLHDEMLLNVWVSTNENNCVKKLNVFEENPASWKKLSLCKQAWSVLDLLNFTVWGFIFNRFVKGGPAQFL